MNLHDRIMNLPHGKEFETFEQHPNTRIAYKIGHRDARHAAAELSLPVEGIIEENLDTYRALAAARTRADILELRWKAKTDECNQLREIIAKLNEQLGRLK